jgi:hypothetical protein
MCQTTDKHSSKDNKIQCLPALTITGLLSSAINGIIGFVAVYFFKPAWEKITRYFQNRESK